MGVTLGGLKGAQKLGRPNKTKTKKGHVSELPSLDVATSLPKSCQGSQANPTHPHDPSGQKGATNALAADETLGVEHGAGGVDGGLVLGGVTNQTLVVVVPAHVGGRDAVTLLVGNDLLQEASTPTHREASSVSDDCGEQGNGRAGGKGGGWGAEDGPKKKGR
jgi:hypothetical protein